MREQHVNSRPPISQMLWNSSRLAQVAAAAHTAAAIRAEVSHDLGFGKGQRPIQARQLDPDVARVAVDRQGR